MKDRLKEKRKDIGLTLQGLACCVGTSKSYIWELENNDQLRPSAYIVQRIADALGTTVNFLMTGNTIDIVDTKMLNTYHKLSPLNKVTLFEFATILLKNQDS